MGWRISGIVAVLWMGGLIAAGNETIAPEIIEALSFHDQFGNNHSLKAFRGEVLVLVYGDRKATKDSRELGERLHIEFHPAAAHLPEDEGPAAPVRPLRGLPKGTASPEIRIVPVACTGVVPASLQKMVASQFRKGSPYVPIWLDMDHQMREAFGLTEGEPNVIVFDGTGRVRTQFSGVPSEADYHRFVKALDDLRRELCQ